MEWETPEATEVSLGCEISGYANAELSAAVFAEPSRKYVFPSSPSSIPPRIVDFPRRRG